MLVPFGSVRLVWRDKLSYANVNPPAGAVRLVSRFNTSYAYVVVFWASANVSLLS